MAHRTPLVKTSSRQLAVTAVRQAGTLLSLEIAQGRREVIAKMRLAGRGVATLAISLVIAACGLCALLTGVLALSGRSAPLWAAALVVAAMAAVVSLFFGLLAREAFADGRDSYRQSGVSEQQASEW